MRRTPNLEAAYAETANDKQREPEAAQWSETTVQDITHATA